MSEDQEKRHYDIQVSGIPLIPHVNFRVRELGEWVDTNTDTYFKGKKSDIICSTRRFHTDLFKSNSYQVLIKQADDFKDHMV